MVLHPTHCLLYLLLSCSHRLLSFIIPHTITFPTVIPNMKSVNIIFYQLIHISRTAEYTLSVYFFLYHAVTSTQSQYRIMRGQPFNAQLLFRFICSPHFSQLTLSPPFGCYEVGSSQHHRGIHRRYDTESHELPSTLLHSQFLFYNCHISYSFYHLKRKGARCSHQSMTYNQAFCK